LKQELKELGVTELKIIKVEGPRFAKKKNLT